MRHHRSMRPIHPHCTECSPITDSKPHLVFECYFSFFILMQHCKQKKNFAFFCRYSFNLTWWDGLTLKLKYLYIASMCLWWFQWPSVPPEGSAQVSARTSQMECYFQFPACPNVSMLKIFLYVLLSLARFKASVCSWQQRVLHFGLRKLTPSSTKRMGA